MIVDHLHHGTRPLVERADRAIGIQFIVLDKVDAGFGENPNETGGLVRVETDTGLDDRADQGSAMDISEAPGSFDPEAGPRIGLCKGGGEAQIDEAKAGELPELEEIAGDGRHQVGERRPEIVERPRDGDAGDYPPAAAVRRAGTREGRGLGFSHDLEPFDTGGGARLQFRRLARHGNERSGGLLAGHRFRGGFGRKSGLDQIVGLDPRRIRLAQATILGECALYRAPLCL